MIIVITKIEFLSTALMVQIDLLASLKLKRWKIPSGEITNLPYLRRGWQPGNACILSTGMADLSDIESALAALEHAAYHEARLRFCIAQLNILLHRRRLIFEQ